MAQSPTSRYYRDAGSAHACRDVAYAYDTYRRKAEDVSKLSIQVYEIESDHNGDFPANTVLDDNFTGEIKKTLLSYWSDGVSDRVYGRVTLLVESE